MIAEVKVSSVNYVTNYLSMSPPYDATFERNTLLRACRKLHQVLVDQANICTRRSGL